LPLSFGKILASRHPSIKQHQAGVELNARTDHELISWDSADFYDGITDHALFFGADLDTPPQLLQMNGDHFRPLSATPLRDFANNLGYEGRNIRKNHGFTTTRPILLQPR
jgi:hypothetical protein